MLETDLTTAAPIVLIHGLRGFLSLISQKRMDREYFPGLQKYLQHLGWPVYQPRVSPTASVAVRSQELKTYLQENLGQQPVHLIGHSMGGLDARYMISRLGMEKQVLSLTTVGTPHWGSSFADWSMRYLSRFYRPIFRLAGIPTEAFVDLTIEKCHRFNEETPNVPGIIYQSVAGVCDPSVLHRGWRMSERIVRLAEGPNDGVVSVTSARWGDQSHIWHGDHLNLINWPNRKMRRAGTWQDRTPLFGELLTHI